MSLYRTEFLGVVSSFVDNSGHVQVVASAVPQMVLFKHPTDVQRNALCSLCVTLCLLCVFSVSSLCFL